MSNNHPTATITFNNGAQVIVELYPEVAPNTVNSFIYLANAGAFDNWRISRVEPGYVVDASTNAFDKAICRYLIENEGSYADENTRIKPALGVIGMGGYQAGIAGGEFFFPLAYHEKIDGKYPMFGRITSGLEEIERIGKLPVRDFNTHPNPNNPMHTTLSDELILSIRVDTNGVSYPEPKRIEGASLPKQWSIEHFQDMI